MIEKNKKYRAFSMIELVVAILILSLIMLASVAVFASIVKARQNVLKVSNDVETSREAIEIITKNMRMGSHLSSSGSAIYFFSEVTDQCISYRFDSITKSLGSDFKQKLNSIDEDCSVVHVGAYTYTPITPANGSMDVTGSFIINPTTPGTTPPRIGMGTIVMLIDGKYDLQTTVSFRNFEGII